MIVAEITRDHLWERWVGESSDNHIEDVSQKGRIFEKEALENWYDYGAEAWDFNELPSEKTRFKLYDDDGELYYSGWLLNDDECLVQQFVLRWAEADSGCTSIQIKDGNEWIYEIG